MVVALPKTYSPEDLLTMPDGDRYELVNGELLERNVSALSSYVAGQVCTALNIHVKPAKLGWVFPDNTSFQIFPNARNKVRKVDTAFIAGERMSVEQVNDQGHIQICPDLVLEVVSPNDLSYEVTAKIEEWLGAGVKVVWVIDPEAKKVQIHRTDGSVVKRGVGDELTAEEILPGFACPIASLFP